VADAEQLKRALFLCDRDELRRQALGELTNYFGDAARAAERDADGKNHARHAAVHVATYRTLGVDKENGDESFLTEFYPPDHFSHIVIDECHRSAWGKWSKVLKMNPGAVQIGLTATPRQLITTEDTPEAKADKELTADNLAYFGEPVYEYEIAQAMEDGYLAACDIKLALVDLDARGLSAAEIIQRNPTDANTGRLLTPQEVADRYNASNFEKQVILPDRVKAMCRDLFVQMIANVIHLRPDGTLLGPRQKTIIFCATDRHAGSPGPNGLPRPSATSWPPSRPYPPRCCGRRSGLSDLKGRFCQPRPKAWVSEWAWGRRKAPEVIDPERVVRWRQ
jgi:type I restriction enzyme R subunit